MTFLARTLFGGGGGAAPVNTSAPYIYGGSSPPQIGDTLYANTGTWTGTPPITYGYNWIWNDTGATIGTSSSYTVQGSDVGHPIAVGVSGTNAYGGPIYAYSSATSPVATPTSSAAYTTPGSYTWVAPAGVTSVSVVAVGGGGGGSICSCNNGGGGGGGLGWKNSISVTPGSSYSVHVGTGGGGATGPCCTYNPGYNGGDSNFACVVIGYGGQFGSHSWCTCRNGYGGGYVGDGGGNGGNGGKLTYYSFTGGGGGAGGYSGCGGSGQPAQIVGCNCGYPVYGGNAGTGGGGGSGYGQGGGGGVGIYGQGCSGAAGYANPYTFCTSYNGGKGGSGGGDGGGRYNAGYRCKGGPGGAYGGGGGSGQFYCCCIWGGDGAGGAVRIVWPGTTRQFPSTCVGSP